MNDTLGYNDNYESPVTIVPEVMAAYEQVNIMLNSWDDDFQQVPSPKTKTSIDLRETIALKVRVGDSVYSVSQLPYFLP